MHELIFLNEQLKSNDCALGVLPKFMAELNAELAFLMPKP